MYTDLQTKTNFRALQNNGRRAPMVVNTGDPELDAKLAGRRSHAADAIKNYQDFNMISDWLVSSRKFMDNAMFVMGCNFGLRCSDLVSLQFKSIIDENGEFYKEFPIVEKKTSHLARMKPARIVPINERAQDAFNLYAGSLHWNFSPDDYIFPNRTNDGPMSYQGVYSKFMRLLDERRGKLNLIQPIHGSTHFMRKTYAYWYIMAPWGERNRKIESLQKAFGHTSPVTTLTYAGITEDEIFETVTHMPIGTYLPLDAFAVDEAPHKDRCGAVLAVWSSD